VVAVDGTKSLENVTWFNPLLWEEGAILERPKKLNVTYYVHKKQNGYLVLLSVGSDSEDGTVSMKLASHNCLN